MNIEEFKKTVKPGGKRSQLVSFSSQIFDLKTQGYAIRQIRDYLASNGLTISCQSITKFIHKNWQDNVSGALSRVTTNSVASTSLPSSSSSFVSDKVKREQIANQYIKDEPISPILRKLIKEKKIENSSDEL